LEALRAGLENPSGAALTSDVEVGAPLGSVSEDFVQLTMPGFSGSSLRSGSRGLEVSPMMSLGSASSRGAGGGGFGRSSGSKFAVVLVVKDPSVCFADIGDGGKFCLKVGCSTAIHKSAKKFDPTDDGSVVIARSQDVAFASPSLGGSVLPQIVLKEWMEDPKTLEDWNSLFRASQGDSSFNSAADHEARLREHQMSETFKTPAKRKGQTSFYPVTGREGLSGYSQSPRHPLQKDSLSSDPGLLSELVLAMDTGLSNLSSSFLKHVEEVKEAVLGLERVDGMLEDHKDSTTGLLGSISVLDNSPFQSPTIFGTLGCLARRVQELSSAAPPIVDFSPVEGKLEDLRRETKKVQNLSIDLTVALSEKIKVLEGRKGNIGLTPVGTAPAKPVVAPPQAAAANPSMDAELSVIRSRLDFLEIENNEQRLEIQRLVAEGDETAIKFAGLGLKSLEDTRAWIDINSPGVALDFSLIPDVYFILELLGEEGEITQAMMLQTMNRLKTLNLDSEYQAKVLSSFQLEVPQFFHGCKDVGGYSSKAGESQLGRLPTYKSWNQGPGSKKKLLERKLPNIRQSFRTLILNAFMVSNPVMYVIAMQALERTLSWITSLASWMDRTYENAHIVSRMPEPKAWGLATQLVRRVFSEIFVVRMGTVQSLAGDRKALCAAVLWSVFRTHDKMNEFESLNFEDHPAIASEHIKFLATNSGFDSLGVLEKEVAGLKLEAKEASRQAGMAVKKADSGSTSAEVNKKAIAELTRRVDKKADK
jgi:hypothetical protein